MARRSVDICTQDTPYRSMPNLDAAETLTPRGVRGYKICLEGPRLAEFAEPLHKEIVMNRPGREEIVQIPVLTAAL